MDLAIDSERRRAALADYLAEATGARKVAIGAMRPMSGGAIQQNWALDFECEGGDRPGPAQTVMRIGNPAGIPESRPRDQEFALIRAAGALGVKVPEALFLEASGRVLGSPFAIFRRLSGTSEPRALLRSLEEESGAALARELAGEIAKLHRLTPAGAPAALAFLGPPPQDPIADRLPFYRERLDRIAAHRPVLEWALDWAAAQKIASHDIAPGEIVLCHRDFRTGNYLTEDRRLIGLLDFEFAGWSDPHEDLGWFFARCWRFGAYGAEAGGIAARDLFLDAYRLAGGRAIDPRKLAFWEILAALRWAIIALEQGARNRREGLGSLDLALTEFRADEAEYDLLLDIPAWEAMS